MRSSRFTGIILIVMGVLLLLDQLDVFYLSDRGIFIFFSLLIGFLFLRKGLIHEHRRGIWLGTFLLACALWLFSMEVYFLADDEPVYVSMFLLSISLAFLVNFSFHTNRSMQLYFGIILGIPGFLILLTHLRYIAIYKLEYILETYWPITLVLLGLTLLGERVFLKLKNSH